jgi:chromosome segregation ATPase
MGGNVSLSPSLHKTHQALQLRLEVDRLRVELQDKDKLLIDAQTKLDEKNSEISHLKERESMCIEDLKVKDFYCGVQDLKIQELEERLSSQRLEYHESVASKQRKYKNLVKKAQQEKADYESQSNSMMKQLNEQMMQLQTFAMQRIQVGTSNQPK